jgi:hypothetical protein
MMEHVLHTEIGEWYFGLMPSAWTLLGPENSFGMTAAYSDRARRDGRGGAKRTNALEGW